MRTKLAVVSAAMVVGLAGCGGGDGDADAKKSGDEPNATKASPRPSAVQSCLKGKGVDAADQSNSFGKKLGIDGAGGRVIIYFEESAQAAKQTSELAENTGETAVVKGTVAITLPSGTDIERSVLEGCVESPG